MKLLCSATVLAALLTPQAFAESTVAGNPVAGKKVFVANCATCHTLKAAGAKGVVASNLDKKRPTYAAVVAVVTKGRTTKGVMPAYNGILTTKQIQDVAAFVYSSTHA